MSSDSNLTLRLLREVHDDVRSFREEATARFDRIEERLDTLEHTVGGMAAHFFAMTNRLADHERRLEKLETRPAK